MSMQVHVIAGCLSALWLGMWAPVWGQQPAVIEVSTDKRQQMVYGMDYERLFHFGGLDAQDLKELARVSVVDCKVRYVRIAIDGAAEFNEGKLDWSAYDRQLQIMSALKAARPDIEFFAIPRPFHEAIRKYYGADSNEAKNAPYTCFPLWIGVFEHPFDKEKRKFVEFKWDKAAEYMARHIQFLSNKGFKISYVDAHNENTKYYRPPQVKLMVAKMRQLLGPRMPLVVAPSGWGVRDTIGWIEEAIQIGFASEIDILASHNTSRPNSTPELQQRVGQLAKSLNKPLWNTEMHGFAGPDPEAVANSEVMWTHVRAGFGGFNDWLTLGNEAKTHKMIRNVGGKLELMRIYYIFKHLVNHSEGGHYLETSIPEGIAATVAFIRGNTLSVWVLNKSAEARPIRIELAKHKPSSSEASIRWWGPNNGREGAAATAKINPDGSCSYTAAANSLYCFTVKR